MGKMKQIYEMVQDGSAEIFKSAYKEALANDEVGFTFNYVYYDMVKARAMLSQIEIADRQYDEWVDHQAEMHAEWKAEIARGK